MAAFASEWVAAFTSEWVAGFVGIRKLRGADLRGELAVHRGG